jgi:RimJ/RimL family protein N-acetyltransferase
MTSINNDAEVMTYFPNTYNEEQTAAFVARMRQSYEERGYCYFAVETIADGRFIGFIGLAWQTYEAPFTPCTDIGWRLDKAAWGRGYATEGAMRCLEYAFHDLGLETIVAVAPQINSPSVNVMQKIGMVHTLDFEHPVLAQSPHLQPCVCYAISKK